MPNKGTKARHVYDKHVISVTQALSTSQVATNLFTVVVPGTFVGLRWLIMVEGANAGTGAWALIQVRDTVTASTMVVTDGGQFYSPEQDLLAFGRFGTTGGAEAIPISENKSGATRKMHVGDHVQFIAIGDVASQGTIKATIQFFIQS